jgi:hypothetical protein
MLRRMVELARARGLTGFTADVLFSNKPMLMVFQRSGLRVESRLDGGVYHVVLHFDPTGGPTTRAGSQGPC